MVEIKDGIVNEEDFHSEGNVKILWILKEANVSPEDIDKVRNLCEEFREGGHQKNALSVPTFRKMIYTSYWILHPEMEWSDIPYANEDECYSVVNKIAYINVNKLPASNVSDDKKLAQVFDENKHVLLEQIKSIDPEVIIFGNTGKFFIDNMESIGWDVSSENKNDDDPNAHYFVTPNKGIAINAYHPAYSRLKDKDYCYSIVEKFKLYKTNQH